MKRNILILALVFQACFAGVASADLIQVTVYSDTSNRGKYRGSEPVCTKMVLLSQATGKPIGGLSEANFTLLQAGRPQMGYDFTVTSLGKGRYDLCIDPDDTWPTEVEFFWLFDIHTAKHHGAFNIQWTDY
jgi:hypothetical protein